MYLEESGLEIEHVGEDSESSIVFVLDCKINYVFEHPRNEVLK